MAEAKLAARDREFFAALDRIVYGNPFSDERARSILQLAPDVANDLDIDRDTLARLVEPRLGAYPAPGALERLPADDRRLVQSGFLYVC